VTILIPSRGVSHEPPKVSPAFGPEHMPTGVVLDERGESIHIDDRDVLLYRTRHLEPGTGTRNPGTANSEP
jgi:hypothetical protein